MERVLTGRFRATKVPDVDLAFWSLKLLSTAMGEAASDFLVHRFNPVAAVLGGALAFAVAMWNQLRAPRYLIGAYWANVTMVAVFGTMCADVVHVGFGVPYPVSTAAFGLILFAVFVTWSRVEETLSIHSITTLRRELFYWAAVCATFALGTAAGDLTASSFGLGYVGSTWFFLALFAIPGVYFALRRRNPVACFWTAYVLTRPLGASVADWLAKPVSVGGANWGTGTVTIIFGTVIVVGVALLQGRSRVARR